MLSLQQTSNATSDRARIAVLVCTHPSTIPLGRANDVQPGLERDYELETTPPSFTYRRALQHIKIAAKLQNADKRSHRDVLLLQQKCRRRCFMQTRYSDGLSLVQQTLIQTLAYFVYWHRTKLVCTHPSMTAQCVLTYRHRCFKKAQQRAC
jgi:hypothetical protein